MGHNRVSDPRPSGKRQGGCAPNLTNLRAKEVTRENENFLFSCHAAPLERQTTFADRVVLAVPVEGFRVSGPEEAEPLHGDNFGCTVHPVQAIS